jgi:uncharacterized BrkB/YihY/UPF0761 family membrane protein
MKKIINFIRNDFRRIHALNELRDRPFKKWMVTIYYILLAPIGFALLPFGWIYLKLTLWKIDRDFRKELEA